MGLPSRPWRAGRPAITACYAGVLIVGLAAWSLRGAAQEAPEPTPVRQLAIANKPWTGDFDRLRERRMIRVLVPYSRTLYFNDKGRERGLTADLVREFEQYINLKHPSGKRPVTVYLIPTTRDKLLQHVADGLGDIAAGNLTVTPARQLDVDFVVQGTHTVKEVVVTGAKAAPVASLADLGGRTVHVRPSSSYHESLLALNERNRQAGLPAVVLRLVPDALEDEDMMEMANAGLIDVLVVDDWKAKMWAQVLPKIVVHDDVSVHDGGQVGWAIRKESPQLAAAIQDFYTNYAKSRASYAYRLAQAMRRVRQMKDPTASADWKRFEAVLELFRRYGDRYGFDPLMLAAQGYQESRLDQAARSHVGAVGVMQLMPATGAEMKVGDIRSVEANIHAGVKYMDILMTRFFQDAHFSEGNRPLFAFAAYNAGPGTIARMRREAVARGLDPDKWFNNVEVLVAEKVGIETTTYVRNIYKYYVSYKLALEAQEAQRKARQAVDPSNTT
ncbi:MAG TPA: transglycosylase SLT domain-containing protein [Thermoanaerobaculia bacterium]|nr:transglycosylase SLT domain-containing protein [Thermoanaerobaculia bacterium]